MGWKIRVSKDAENEIERLDHQIQCRIISFLKERILSHENPRNVGRALTGKFSGLWKYRVGDYRIICDLQDSVMTVLVVSVGHRRHVYH